MNVARLDNGKRIFAFSDTHGLHRKLVIPEETEILVCAGDAVEDSLDPEDYTDSLDGINRIRKEVRRINSTVMNTVTDMDEMGDPQMMKKLFDPDTLTNDERFFLSRLSSARGCFEQIFQTPDQFSNGETAIDFFNNELLADAVYFLDVPENSLAPDLQLELAHRLELLSHYLNRQIIIATHSPFLLSMRDAKMISMDSLYISADFYEGSIGGITPVSESPALFMCFLLTSFDASVPEIIRVIKKEEYKVSSDYRRHMVREQTIRGLLAGLIDKDDIEYRIAGRDGTECVLELPDDDILLVFTVTDRDLEEGACNLREEIRHIRIAPFVRVHDFGDRYSLESYV